MARWSRIEGAEAGLTHSRCLPKQVVRPSHEEVKEQHHQNADKATSQNEDTPVESAQLLLSVDRAPLKLQRLTRDPAVLCEMLALSVAHLLQQLVGSVVSFHHSPLCRRDTG